MAGSLRPRNFAGRAQLESPSYPAMPKQKTHKGVKKRFRLTARGKIKHRHAGTSHLQSRLTKKRKRNLRGTTVLAPADTQRIAAALAGHSY